MKSITKLSISFFLFLFLLSCSDEYYLISNNYQLIEVSEELDSSVVNIINPYKHQLDKQMNRIICFTKRWQEPGGSVNNVDKKDTIITEHNSKEIIRVLTTDYLANGGDNMKFFINKEQKKVGIKLRDAIIEYCIEKDTLDIQIDNRLIFDYEK